MASALTIQRILLHRRDMLGSISARTTVAPKFARGTRWATLGCNNVYLFAHGFIFAVAVTR